MAERDTRIRWTGRERDVVVREYHALCASNATLSMVDLLTAAQKALPKERQRPPSYALRAWFNKELKAKLDADSRRAPGTQGTLARPGDGAGGSVTIAGTGRNGTRTAGVEGDVSPQALAAAVRNALRSPLAPEEMKSLSELGVEIAVRVLNDSRVRQAVRNLAEGSRDDPFLAPRTTFQTSSAPVAKLKVAATEPTSPSTPEPAPRSGKMRVLIAGPANGQLADVRAPFEAHLQLESWSPDQGFEQLRTLVDNVDVVIGMPSMLTQAVQNTLRHYAKRYVRHTTGISGLGGELGKLVPGEAK